MVQINVPNAQNSYCLSRAFIPDSNTSVVVFECLRPTGGCVIRFNVKQECAFFGTAYLAPLAVASTVLSGLFFLCSAAVLVYALGLFRAHLIKGAVIVNLSLTAVSAALFLVFWALFYVIAVTNIGPDGDEHLQTLSVVATVCFMVCFMLQFIVQMLFLHQWLQAALVNRPARWRTVATVCAVSVSIFFCALVSVYVGVYVSPIFDLTTVLIWNVVFLSAIFGLYFLFLCAQLALGIYLLRVSFALNSKVVRLGALLMTLVVFNFMRFLGIVVYVWRSANIPDSFVQFYPAFLYIGAAGISSVIVLYYFLAAYLLAFLGPGAMMLFVLFYSIALEKKDRVDDQQLVSLAESTAALKLARKSDQGAPLLGSDEYDKYDV